MIHRAMRKEADREVVEMTAEEEQALSEANAATPEVLRRQDLDQAIGADAQIAALKAMTNAEYGAWFDANVTNAAQAIGLLKRVVRVLIRRVL